MAAEMEVLIRFGGEPPHQDDLERVLQQTWFDCYVLDSTTEEV